MQNNLSAKAQTTLRLFFTVCLVATLIFIFANSADTADISGGKSEDVVAFINSLLQKIAVPVRVTEHIVRKAAHFSEYMLLGFWVWLTAWAYTVRPLRHLAWMLFFGLLIPVTDETLQLFVPGRAGQVSDVLIDFCGVLCGLLAGALACRLAAALRRKRQKGRIL